MRHGLIADAKWLTIPWHVICNCCSAEPHPKVRFCTPSSELRRRSLTTAFPACLLHQLPGTIHTAVEDVNRIGDETGSGAKGLAIQLDVRDAKAVEDAIEQTVGKFGHLDYAVNNVGIQQDSYHDWCQFPVC